MKEHGNLHNGTAKIVKWIVDKILPWVIIAVIGFGIEMLTWRVEINDQLEHLDEHLDEMEQTIMEMKRKMDIAVSTQPAGHMTHREFILAKQDFERRLERLEQ